MTHITAGDFASIDIDIDPDITDHDNYSATPPATSSEIESEPAPLRRTRSLSDALSRSTPVLFIREHGRKMIGRDEPSCDDRDRSWTSWVVGASCGCFLMPSLTILVLGLWAPHFESVRLCIIFDCVYFVVVAVCSFLSDFVYCYAKDPPCKFETIDQWTATGGVVVVAANILLNPYPLSLRALDVALLLAALALIGRSRKSTEAAEWRKWHCCWHLMAGIGTSYIYVQEYLMRTGTFRTIGDSVWWP